MPVTKDQVIFKLEVDSSGAVKGLNTISVTTDKLGKSAKSASKKTDDLGKGLKNLGISTIALNQAAELYNKTMLVLNKTWDATIGRSLKLEKNIAEITTLISDSTGMNEKFTESILRMQEQFGSDQTDTALAFYQAISSGAVSASTANELLITANKLAIGGVTNLSTAVDGLTSIVNAYGLEAKDALAVSDALFLGMKFGTTTIQKLSIDLGRVTGLAAATGVGFQEVIAATAAITTGGVRTSEAITQIRSAMVALNKQTGPMQELLEKLGITSIKATIQQKGLVAVLKDIRARTDGTTESLTELFGRVEAMNAVLALTSNKIGSKYLTIMGEMGKISANTGRISEEAFNKIAETADFQLDVSLGKLVASFTRLGIVFMDIVLPAIVILVDTISTLTRILTTTLDLTLLLITDGKIAATVLIGIGAAASSAALGVGGLTSAFLNLSIILSAVTSKITVATSAISGFALAAGKIGAAAAGAVTLLSAIEVISSNLMKIDEVLALFVQIFRKAFKNIAILSLDMYMNMTLSAKKFLSDLGVLPDTIEGLMTNSINRMVTELDLLSEEAKELDKDISKISSGLDLGFTDKLVEKIRGVGTEIESIIGGATSADAEAAMNRILDLTKDQIAAIRQMTQENKSLQTEIDNIGATKIEQIENERVLAQAALEMKKQSLIAEKKISKELLRQIEIQKGLIDEKAEKKTDAVKKPEFFDPDMMGQLTEGMGSFGESVGGFMTAASSMAAVPMAIAKAALMIIDFFQQIVDIIPSILDAFAGLVNSIADFPMTLLKSISGVFDALAGLIPTFVRGVFELFFSLLEKVIPGFIDGFITGIADLIIDLPDMIVRLLTESIPKFISGVITGLLGGAGKLAVAFMHFLIKGVPKMLVALDKMIPLIIRAIGTGLVEAFKTILGFAAETFSGKEMAEDFTEGIKGSSKDVFAVLDLEQNAAAVSASNKIKEALRDGWGLFTALWAELERIWKDVWKWFEHWINELDKVWKDVWGWIEHWINELDKVWKDVWRWIEHWISELDKVWKDVWIAAEKAWKDIWIAAEKAWDDIWGKVDEKLIQPIKEAFSGLFDVEQWKNVGDDIWKGLKGGLDGIGNVLKDALNSVQMPDLLKKLFPDEDSGKGDIERALNVDVPYANFAQGGVVPGSASLPGDHLSNDTVPALLSPNEVVIPRSLTRIPEVMATLKSIMAGNIPKKYAFGKKGDLNPFDDGGGGGGGSIFGNLDPRDVSMEDLENLGNKAAEGLDTLVSILSRDELLKKFSNKMRSELVDGLKKQNGFEDGGPVTSTGPAFVHQGEFVLNKKTVDSINSSSQSFDSGGGGSVNQDFQINVNVSGGDSVDEGSLARNIMDEIKEASIQGRFIMSTKGLRTT